jgi:hypothetical protein
LIKILGLYPEKMHLEALNEIDVSATIPGLRAKGWKLLSITQEMVKAEHSGYRVSIENGSITFEGFTPQQILGDADKGTESQLVSGVLLLLGGDK